MQNKNLRNNGRLMRRGRQPSVILGHQCFVVVSHNTSTETELNLKPFFFGKALSERKQPTSQRHIKAGKDMRKCILTSHDSPVRRLSRLNKNRNYPAHKKLQLNVPSLSSSIQNLNGQDSRVDTKKDRFHTHRAHKIFETSVNIKRQGRGHTPSILAADPCSYVMSP